MEKSVYIVSVEPSGDALAVDLIRDLRTLSPGIELHALGGDLVRQEGFYPHFDPAPLAVLGFSEGLAAIFKVRRLSRILATHIIQTGAEVCVLIDAWGFNIRVAKELRRMGYGGRIIKYVAPQVWAMRAGRAKVLARYVDGLLCLYPFDPPPFQAEGLPTLYVGNPVLETDHAKGDGAAFRKRHRIAAADPVLLVAFGSRASELERLLPPFLETVRHLRDRRPGLCVVTPVVPDVAPRLAAQLFNDREVGHSILQVPPDERLDAFAAVDIALAASGTVTTQLADARVPTAVAYRVSPLTYKIAKRIFRSRFISIVNVVADAPLMPEFIQDDVVPDTMADWLDGCLSDPTAARKLMDSLRATTDKMRLDAGEDELRAAQAILSVMETSETLSKSWERWRAFRYPSHL